MGNDSTQASAQLFRLFALATLVLARRLGYSRKGISRPEDAKGAGEARKEARKSGFK